MAHVNRVFIGQAQTIWLVADYAGEKSAQIHYDSISLVFSSLVQYRLFIWPHSY